MIELKLNSEGFSLVDCIFTKNKGQLLLMKPFDVTKQKQRVKVENT